MIDTLLIIFVLTNFIILGSSRLGNCIRIVSTQGIILGLLTLVVHKDHITIHSLVLALGNMGLKGFVFPWLLYRAIREANVHRELEPIVGYNASFLIGILTLGLSFSLGSFLRFPRPIFSALLVGVALFAIFVGLFLIVSRRKAMTQVLGYIVMENGIFTFGLSLSQDAPMMVELGILLDIFVAVFVMGIAVFHIHREFDHIDTDRLSALKDWVG